MTKTIETKTTSDDDKLLALAEWLKSELAVKRDADALELSKARNATALGRLRSLGVELPQVP